MSANRHLGRIIVLQTLYEQEFRIDCGDKSFDLDEVLQRNIDRYKDTISDVEFVERMVHGVTSSIESLDVMLQPVASDWPIDQIARMDRSVLRMSVWELYNDSSTPAKVVINEAVELAKAFGGDNSSKFINGVLGTIMRGKEAEESPAKAEQPKEEKE